MTTIKLKRTTVADRVPTVSDVVEGEVAINITDGKIWAGDGSGVVLLGGLQDGSDLPTSDPEVVGALWNDSGTVKISAG